MGGAVWSVVSGTMGSKVLPNKSGSRPKHEPQGNRVLGGGGVNRDPTLRVLGLKVGNANFL